MAPIGYGTYRISANSFRGNYTFLKLTLCTVTFGDSTQKCGNYSREESIQGRKLFAEIRYAKNMKNIDISIYLRLIYDSQAPSTIKGRQFFLRLCFQYRSIFQKKNKIANLQFSTLHYLNKSIERYKFRSFFEEDI